MDFSKLGGLISSVAPTLATAIGGPLAGLAVKTVSNVLLGRPDGSQEELEKAIQTATPEQILQLKKTDADFRIRMKELDIDLEKIAAQDRSEARQKETTTRDWTPRILAFIVVGGFFTIIFGSGIAASAVGVPTRVNKPSWPASLAALRSA